MARAHGENKGLGERGSLWPLTTVTGGSPDSLDQVVLITVQFHVSVYPSGRGFLIRREWPSLEITGFVLILSGHCFMSIPCTLNNDYAVY